MSTKWEEMQPTERDSWIAEHVMKWNLRGNEFDGYWWTGAAVLTRPPNNGSLSSLGMVWEPTTSSDCDYLVLQKVRQKWGPARASKFSGILVVDMWAPRRSRIFRGLSYADHLMYETGDYSHAAFLALNSGD